MPTPAPSEILLIIILIFPCICSPILAFHKHRSPVCWFVIGLIPILGYLGLIVVLFLPRLNKGYWFDKQLGNVKTHVKAGQSLNYISRKTCLTNEEITQECLRLLRSESITEHEYEKVMGRPMTLEEKAEVTRSKKCPHCAEIIKQDAVVCRYCGRDL